MGGVGSGIGSDGRGQDLEARAADARLERMDRVAVLYAEITAATRAFLAALAESDRHRDWEAEGFGSCAEWLAWRLGITRNTANEKVRTARALEHLPLTSEAMARGELSFSKVRALTRAATAENEAELLELARAGSAAKLERMIRGWRRLDRADEARRERALHAARTFSVFPDEDGMYLVRGRLPAEVGALLMRAVEAASDALYRREQGASGEAGSGSEGDPDPGREGEATDPAQRRADALGLLAERALAAGFGGEAGGPEADAPISGVRAERYQVMLHVEAGGLSETGQAELSELGDGTRVPAETARRLACDAARVRVATDARGSVLDVGRRTRTVPPSLRRALEARDRGCRFPACGLRFTDAHHIVHWADGGETSLANTVLLCRRHHRRVHEDGWHVCSDRTGEQVVFFRPDGRALAEAPPLGEAPPLPEAPALPEAPPLAEAPPPPEVPPSPEPEGEVDGRGCGTRPRNRIAAGTDPDTPLRDPALALLQRRNRTRGIQPDGRALAPRYRRDSLIPWSVEAAAREALDPWDTDPEPAAREALDPWDTDPEPAGPEALDDEHEAAA